MESSFNSVYKIFRNDNLVKHKLKKEINFMFTIVKKDKNSLARAGIIETAHGIVETPAYAIVGTHGSIKCLPTEMISETKSQLVIANTFHIWQNAGGSKTDVKNLPKVHELLGQNMPIMTDSGGFQVFSMGFGREHQIGKIARDDKRFDLGQIKVELFKRPEKNLVKITDEGAFFQVDSKDGQKKEFLGPELSIKIQEALGADIILAFDECTSPLHDYQYTAGAMERTHRWAKICLETKSRKDQLLYGIVQGGEFRDLREESARLINSLPFDGIAVGGSLGKSKSGAFDVLKWTVPLLNEDKPRHFLGIGQIADLFEAVELGIDTFDCVIPTREARHGGIYTKNGRIDIKKSVYKDNSSTLDHDCQCPVCAKITKSELHQQFRSKDPLAGQNATIHNVYFFNSLMAQIRQAIKNDKLGELKKIYLK